MSRTGSAPPLAFGLGWHSAMDIVWAELPSLSEAKDEEEIVTLAQKAYAAWESDWTEQGFPSASDMTEDWTRSLKARTPDTAIEMLLGYILERWDQIRHQYKLIAIEQPFVVPLDPDDPYLWYSGRLDKVIEHRDKYWIVDHKTTSLYAIKGGFKRSFLESFSPDSQMDGYAYGAKLLYGDKFGGVFIDGSLVNKTHHEEFCWFPVSRTSDQLDAWLWETREEIYRIEADRTTIGNDKGGSLTWTEPTTENADPYLTVSRYGLDTLSYMPAAPKNTGACWNFNNPCTYSELCKSWGNPLKGLSEHGLPLGYVIDEWSPFSDEQRAEVENLIKKFNPEIKD